MKKYYLSLILAISIVLPASAVDYIAGAKAGYFIWKPYFEDIGGFLGYIDKGKGVLYGPVLSVLFTPDISFSMAGLTGTQSTYWHMDFEEEDSPEDVRAGTYFWETQRYDIDTALSYRISNMKVFLGYKYQYMDSKMISTEVRPDVVPPIDTAPQIYHDKGTFTTMSNGPALGLGYSHVFEKGFFASANISVLYMFGYSKMDTIFHYKYNSAAFSFDKEGGSQNKLNMFQVGTNIEPSIGYMAESTGLVFTLGGRFQWLRTKFPDLTKEEKADFGGVDEMDDFLYGIFVSVLYSF